MNINLITDPWIPVITTDGPRVIAPWQMADASVMWVDWPRADLNIACLELLIGLVFLADPPRDLDDWFDRADPDPDRLRDRLAGFAPAFDLLGDGPRFMQDLQVLQGDPNPPDMLFIDSAGAQTAKNNADLLVHRGRYPALSLPLAAMAIYAFQDFAPSGGAGNRTSMRGGGPMVTLVAPENAGLWQTVWANTPYGQPAGMDALPWMRPCVESTNDRKVWPEQTHPVEAFFGMPRRLRLVGDDAVTGVIQRPYGTNYAGWVHPLSPYYRVKEGAELLPAHPRAGLFGYRNWLGVVAASSRPDLRQRAAVLAEWHDRGMGAPARVIVAGWAMDNMKPRDFILSTPPLVHLDATSARLMEGMVDAADQYGLALRQALAPVLAEGEAREAVREAFFAQTQAAFEARLADLPNPDAATGWLGDMRNVALTLFDTRAIPGLADRDTRVQQAIVQARRNLTAAFNGYGSYGKKAFGAMELPLPETKSKQKRDAA
ncbi:type I-E CRISPR-associated protein Cse1/CasA [Paracoccus sp. (in: a-proteobacteria)]|uniref:type I-E CRISPR-associated protein Cse1/CasA n=1 Tax=Paracoccus sp. TaxID=267 RepID=UPI0026E05D37|nr:type I-E CRISPR-associated protein Cse1/CasA [Paracoccus sp. (in: a-proteobacteria)]MDO5647525.1 type I-E CRISPR-associated protein Cse1/CasA [Paracoccus sp. (in: a-proteobacteria)]